MKGVQSGNSFISAHHLSPRRIGIVEVKWEQDDSLSMSTKMSDRWMYEGWKTYIFGSRCGGWSCQRRLDVHAASHILLHHYLCQSASWVACYENFMASVNTALTTSTTRSRRSHPKTARLARWRDILNLEPIPRRESSQFARFHCSYRAYARADARKVQH